MSTKPAFNPFRAALAYLRIDQCSERDGKFLKTYICWCLDDLHDDQSTSMANQALCLLAAAHVQHMLGDVCLVEYWLRDNVPGFKKAEDKAKNDRAKDVKFFITIQQYRHRWLTHMADQYDAGLIVLAQ